MRLRTSYPLRTKTESETDNEARKCENKQESRLMVSSMTDDMRHPKLRSCGGIFCTNYQSVPCMPAMSPMPIFIGTKRKFLMLRWTEETKNSFRDFRWIAGRQNKCAMIDPPLLSFSRSMLIMKARGGDGRKEGRRE